MHLHLPQYTKSDRAIMLFIVLPWIVVQNWLIVGRLYFSSLLIFVAATAIIFALSGISWQVHSWIAVTLRERFPAEKQTATRLLIAIPLFILITALTTTLFFWGYDFFKFLGADFKTDNYQTALIIGAFINVFVTFVHEGVTRFEKWKAVLIENEQLKKEYLQSQLLGLKSQINPHFLFNSLNSLSSLINDNEQEAEIFLDELSKVYRYLLRNNEEELVTLHTELDFVQSFFYLLKARYGRAVELHVHVTNEDAEKRLPPLTLQMLLEDIFNANTGTKEQPLVVEITATDAGLELRNTVHKKIMEEGGVSSNLENVMNKIWLLCQKRVEVAETGNSRVIRLPLITEKKDRAA